MLRTRNLLLFRVVSTGKQIVREIERKYSPIHWNSNFNCSTVQEQNKTVFQLPRLTLQSPGLPSRKNIPYTMAGVLNFFEQMPP